MVVAVKSNRCAALKNPERPVITEEQRVAIVDAIRYVDYTIIVDYDPNTVLEFEPENKKQEEWLIIFQDLFALFTRKFSHLKGAVFIKEIKVSVTFFAIFPFHLKQYFTPYLNRQF